MYNIFFTHSTHYLSLKIQNNNLPVFEFNYRTLMVEINHFDDVPKAISIKATGIGYHQFIFFSLLHLQKENSHTSKHISFK